MGKSGQRFHVVHAVIGFFMDGALRRFGQDEMGFDLGMFAEDFQPPDAPERPTISRFITAGLLWGWAGTGSRWPGLPRRWPRGAPGSCSFPRRVCRCFPC